ncbi:DUF5713 family protein [Streptomyces sp. NPDC048290]|uniref:DUF5713 family protein n=1 Tax=Streptomyces sp. NPDC048290 TaxID=3155811 RepID=UPI003420CECD
MPIAHEQASAREFLALLYGDTYFPQNLVDKGRDILVRLCERIETEPPADLDAFYTLTHAATEEFNALQEEFWAAGSEIETMARDEIAKDFWFIAQTYGFEGADLEEVVGPRDW